MDILSDRQTDKVWRQKNNKKQWGSPKLGSFEAGGNFKLWKECCLREVTSPFAFSCTLHPLSPLPLLLCWPLQLKPNPASLPSHGRHASSSFSLSATSDNFNRVNGSGGCLCGHMYVWSLLGPSSAWLFWQVTNSHIWDPQKSRELTVGRVQNE